MQLLFLWALSTWGRHPADQHRGHRPCKFLLGNRMSELSAIIWGRLSDWFKRFVYTLLLMMTSHKTTKVTTFHYKPTSIQPNAYYQTLLSWHINVFACKHICTCTHTQTWSLVIFSATTVTSELCSYTFKSSFVLPAQVSLCILHHPKDLWIHQGSLPEK